LADDAELRATLAAAEPPLTPTVAAAAAPSPVACRKRRRLKPGGIRRSGCRADPVAPGACSRGSSELVIAVSILSVQVTKVFSVGAAGRVRVNAPCQSPDGKINTLRIRPPVPEAGPAGIFPCQSA
jgi:hypothetical protein